MLTQEPTATTVSDRIAEELFKSGIKLVASLPDGWIANLIETLDRDERFIHVPVNREESAIGLCSGAFLGGIGALALMGASGLMTCIYAITKINYSYQIPILIFITLRGDIGDPQHHHVSNALYLRSVMEAMSLPYTIVDSTEKISVIPAAYRQARAMNRPVVVAFTRAVLRGRN